MAGFTVSSLTTYIKENADKIQAASITQAETLKLPGINIMAGIKNAEKLMLLANSAPFQANSGCGFNASGSTTFTDRTLTVSKLKVQDEFCVQDLELKYTNTKLAPGSNYDSLPFEQQIMDLVTQNINFGMEQAVWQGDTDLTANTTLKQFDGWLKTIDAASPVYATATADVTTGNIIGILDNIYTLIPASLLNNPAKPLFAFMGWDTFRLLVIAAKALNYYHFDPAQAYATGELIMPGTGLKVKAVHGLDAISGSLASYTDRIVCTWAGNLAFGTDLTGEENDVRGWYSMDDDKVKYSIKWKAGTQIAYGSEIVTYKNS